jgi:hypothetical protein
MNLPFREPRELNGQFRDNNWLRAEYVDQRTVPVEFRDRPVPGVFARVGRLAGAHVFCIVGAASEPYDEWTTNAATRVLRASGRILPIQSVGNPSCTATTCVLTGLYSDEDLGPRRHVLESISAGAQTMREKRMFAKVAMYKDFPEDLELHIKQYLLPIRFPRPRPSSSFD